MGSGTLRHLGAPSLPTAAAFDRNPRLLCAYHALQMSLFPIAIITLFWKHAIGMSMAEILGVQAIFGLTVAALEFPTGYLADRIGYRRTLVVAAGLMFCGWSVYSAADTLAGVIAAEMALGVAMSLISGADTALLYESLVAVGRETEFAQWNGRVRFWGQVGEGSAALVAGVLYAWWPRLPFVLELAVWGLGIVVALRLVEPARERARLSGNLAQARAMVTHLAVENRPLRAIVFLTIALGMSSFVPVWLIQIYAADAGVPPAWLGPLWAGANYVVAIGSIASARAERLLGRSRLVLLSAALIFAGYLGLGLSHAVWGCLFYYLLTLMRGLFAPALGHHEQRLIPSRDRAGFLSLRSLIFRASFAVIGPTIGWLIDAHGQHAVLLGVGGVLTAAVLIGWRWVERSAPIV